MLSRFILMILYSSILLGEIRSHSLMVGKDNAANGTLMRPKRDGTQYTIEVVVAVDKGVMDYYGGEIWDVVMASMAQTSDIYENSNLKQSISVSLVDLIQLPFDPSEGNLNENGDKDAQKMLTKFCDYMKKLDIKRDVAMLLTRAPMFSNTNPPGRLQGLSNIKAMCNPDACMILEDSFIFTGWVAAHELGHSYGAWHEEASQCASYPKWDGKNIMQQTVGQSWNFSECTQAYVDKFLEDDQSKCLTEQAAPNKLASYQRNDNLFTIARQCKEYLGDEYNTKDPWMEATDDCTRMWCLKKDGKAKTNMAPWVNGTPCGKDKKDNGKKCNHLECV